jgi:hypothetical protein
VDRYVFTAARTNACILLLVGLPPTATDIQTVTADPTKLASLIQTWMGMPEYQGGSVVTGALA